MPSLPPLVPLKTRLEAVGDHTGPPSQETTRYENPVLDEIKDASFKLYTAINSKVR